MSFIRSLVVRCRKKKKMRRYRSSTTRKNSSNQKLRVRIPKSRPTETPIAGAEVKVMRNLFQGQTESLPQKTARPEPQKVSVRASLAIGRSKRTEETKIGTKEADRRKRGTWGLLSQQRIIGEASNHPKTERRRRKGNQILTTILSRTRNPDETKNQIEKGIAKISNRFMRIRENVPTTIMKIF